MSAGSANKSSGVPAGVPTTPAASEAAPMDVDPVQLISDGLSAVTEGCRLPVKMAGPGDDWPMAEVCYKRIYFLLTLCLFLPVPRHDFIMMTQTCSQIVM